MSFDFTKLESQDSFNKALKPRELFALMPKKISSKYKYLRDFQAEVLNAWYERRNESEIILKMNTGSGKTLVGLLILKSCLNEGKGPAVFVVPDPYLVSQVMKVGEETGISLTNETSADFFSGKSILVVNIHKLFNGKSVFGVRGGTRTPIQIGSIIIDDVHACLEKVKEQFTLHVDTSDACRDLYNEIHELFKTDLLIQAHDKYLDIERQYPYTQMLVPFWAWQNKIEDVERAIHKHESLDAVKFPYPFLRGMLGACRCTFGGSSIEISPHFPDIDALPSFKNAARKIVMSATISDDSPLVGIFNFDPQKIKTPITPAYANDIGDRMILVPQELNKKISEEQFRDYLVNLSQKHNVVVLVPSNDRAKFWQNVAKKTLRAENIYEGVQELIDNHVGLVVIVNRYDGIDLPEDACRILVIDGIPSYSRLYDKVTQSYVQTSPSEVAKLIQKIEQGMGRGIRSNDDQCIVFLMGASLVSTIYVNNARKFFSPATLAQFELSEKVSEQLKGKKLNDIDEVINFSLEKNEKWLQPSKAAVLNVKYDDETRIDHREATLRNAFNLHNALKTRAAFEVIEKLANNESDQAMKGYLKQIAAEYLNFQDPIGAQRLLKSAHTENRYLLKPVAGIDYLKLNKFTQGQAANLSKFLKDRFSDDIGHAMLRVNSLIETLQFVPENATQFEAALKETAKFLGFFGQRPESEYGRGPDILWEVGGLKYFVIECKSGVTSENGTINKHDCNQLNGSITWFKTKYDKSCRMEAILIHPHALFEYACSPDEGTKIMAQKQLQDFREALQAFYEVIIQNGIYADPLKLESYLVKWSLTQDTFAQKYTTGFKIKNVR